MYFYIRSSELTLISHTITLGNLAGLFLIYYGMARGNFLSKSHFIGTAFIVLGALSLFLKKETKGTGKETSLWGDMNGVFCSIAYAFVMLSTVKLL